MIKRQPADHQGIVAGGLQTHGSNLPLRLQVLDRAHPNDSLTGSELVPSAKGSLEVPPAHRVAKRIREVHGMHLSPRQRTETEVPPGLHHRVGFEPAANGQDASPAVVVDKREIGQMLSHLLECVLAGLRVFVLIEVAERTQAKEMRCLPQGNFHARGGRLSGLGAECYPTFTLQVFRAEQERDSLQITFAARDANQGVLGGIPADHGGLFAGAKVLRGRVEVGTQVDGSELTARVGDLRPCGGPFRATGLAAH